MKVAFDTRISTLSRIFQVSENKLTNYHLHTGSTMTTKEIMGLMLYSNTVEA
jgi:hypothetical protein